MAYTLDDDGYNYIRLKVMLKDVNKDQNE